MPPAHLAGCELIQIMECNFCVILLLTEQILGEDCVLATLLGLLRIQRCLLTPVYKVSTYFWRK